MSSIAGRMRETRSALAGKLSLQSTVAASISDGCSSSVKPRKESPVLTRYPQALVERRFRSPSSAKKPISPMSTLISGPAGNPRRHCRRPRSKRKPMVLIGKALAREDGILSYRSRPRRGGAWRVQGGWNGFSILHTAARGRAASISASCRAGDLTRNPGENRLARCLIAWRR